MAVEHNKQPKSAMRYSQYGYSSERPGAGAQPNRASAAHLRVNTQQYQQQQQQQQQQKRMSVASKRTKAASKPHWFRSLFAAKRRSSISSPRQSQVSASQQQGVRAQSYYQQHQQQKQHVKDEEEVTNNNGESRHLSVLSGSDIPASAAELAQQQQQQQQQHDKSLPPPGGHQGPSFSEQTTAQSSRRHSLESVGDMSTIFASLTRTQTADNQPLGEGGVDYFPSISSSEDLKRDRDSFLFIDDSLLQFTTDKRKSQLLAEAAEGGAPRPREWEDMHNVHHTLLPIKLEGPQVPPRKTESVITTATVASELDTEVMNSENEDEEASENEKARPKPVAKALVNPLKGFSYRDGAQTHRASMASSTGFSLRSAMKGTRSSMYVDAPSNRQLQQQKQQKQKRRVTFGANLVATPPRREAPRPDPLSTASLHGNEQAESKRPGGRAAVQDAALSKAHLPSPPPRRSFAPSDDDNEDEETEDESESTHKQEQVQRQEQVAATATAGGASVSGSDRSYRTLGEDSASEQASKDFGEWSSDEEDAQEEEEAKPRTAVKSASLLPPPPPPPAAVDASRVAALEAELGKAQQAHAQEKKAKDALKATLRASQVNFDDFAEKAGLHVKKLALEKQQVEGELDKCRAEMQALKAKMKAMHSYNMQIQQAHHQLATQLKQQQSQQLKHASYYSRR